MQTQVAASRCSRQAAPDREEQLRLQQLMDIIKTAKQAGGFNGNFASLPVQPQSSSSSSSSSSQVRQKGRSIQQTLAGGKKHLECHALPAPHFGPQPLGDGSLGSLGPIAEEAPPTPLLLAVERPQPAAAVTERDSMHSEKRLSQCDITTLMISHLPPSTTVEGMRNDLDAAGFKDLYDFIYLPHKIATKEVVGYSFINFVSAEAAASFSMFISARQPPGGQLVASPAKVQGIEALTAWCIRRGLHKLRNSRYRPWVKDKSLLPYSL